MSNRNELLASLKDDFQLCKDYLQQLSEEVTSQGISNYPIYIATKLEAAPGRLIIDKRELEISWSFYASHLEHFVNEGIIDKDKVDAFRQAYKDPSRFACIFAILNEQDMNFIFIPYKSSTEERLERPL